MEEYIAKFYLIQTDSKILKILDIFEIVSHLENDSLMANSYVFDLRIVKWIQVKDIEVLKDTGYLFHDSPDFKMPSFIPPHKLPSNYLMDVENSDYLFLRDNFKIKLSSNNFHETIQLENTIVELNKQIDELDISNYSSNELTVELENIIAELKTDADENNERINLLEKKLLEKEITLKDLKVENNVKFEDFKLENQDSINLSKELKSKTESLTYTIRSLKFALRLEKEKYLDLKTFISSIIKKEDDDKVKDKVIEQAFNYFIQGPVGNGVSDLKIEKLEKKIEFLEEEMKEKEEFYKEKISLNSSSADEDNEMYRNKVTDLEKRYQIKITDLGNDKRELRAKINALESDLNQSNEKTDALLNTVSSDFSSTHSSSSELELRYVDLKTRFEESVENYEQMLEHKENKIRDLIANSQDLQVHSITQTMASLKQEIIKYKKSYEATACQKNVLTNQVKKLTEQRMELGNKVNSQQEILNQYKNVNQKLVSQIEEFKKKTGSYKEEYKKLFDKNNKAIQKIQSQSSKIETLHSEKENGLVQSQKEVDDLVNQMLDFKAEAQREKKNAKKLQEDLISIKDEEEKKIELAYEKNIKSSASQEELSRLIGDSYEVENDLIWTVQFEDGMKTGPHAFSVVYDMKESGEISKTTRVKKDGQGYKSCRDIFELSTKVIIHGEDASRRFFIKRNSVRVPYYDLIIFEMGGKEFKGYCTSISSGGIFIELTSVKEEDFQNNAKGRVLFSKGALESPFNCIAQIKNISLERPKGIGLMFIDLPDNAEKDILNFVNSYLNQSKKSA